MARMLAMTGVDRSYASAITQTMQKLTVQAEVGSTMEGMLADLEAWDWANKEEVLKKELEHARAQVEALKQSERNLLEVRARVFAWSVQWKLFCRDGDCRITPTLFLTASLESEELIIHKFGCVKAS